MDDNLRQGIVKALRLIQTYQTDILAPMSALFDDTTTMLTEVLDGKRLADISVDPIRIAALQQQISVNSDMLDESLNRAMQVFIDAIERGEIK